MSLRIDELVADPMLGLRVLAGERGCRRRVGWAHACELANPWDWLEPGDMLLSNGFSIPADVDDQVEFLRRLERADLAALTIGERQRVPDLHPAAIALADERAFPILECEFRVPFVAVAKAIGLATLPSAQEHLPQLVRIYDRARETTLAGEAGEPGGTLLAAISRDLGCRLWVIAPEEGLELLPGPTRLPRGLGGALADAYRERGRELPAALRLPERETLAVPLPSRRPAALVASTQGGRSLPPLALLQHVATVAALEVERGEAERERRRRLGSELLAHVLDDRLDPNAAGQILSGHGFASEDRLALLIVREGADDDGRELGGLLDAGLHDLEVPHLVLRRGDDVHVLVPHDDAAYDAVRAALPAGLAAGVSEPFGGLGRARDAVREAAWARGVATEAGPRAGLTFYGQQRSHFLPRTISDADAVAEHVLGAAVAYDRENGTQLVASVEAYLAENRSGQRAAARLFVHRQTLVYRVRRFEEITGRKLDDIDDVAELWLALRARRLGTEDPAKADAGRSGPAAESERGGAEDA